MSFQSLSAEILGLIVSYMNGDKTVRLSRYAALTPAFQGAIENLTFTRMELSSDDLEEYSKLLANRPSRCAALGMINFAIILPTYSDQACAWFEREVDQKDNNEAFSTSIASLFGVLSHCDRAPSARPVKLHFSYVYSPMDDGWRGAEKDMADRNATHLGKRKDLRRFRYNHSYLRLLRADELPQIQRVKSFTISRTSLRYIEPAVVATLATRFPKVKSMDWELQDSERKLSTLRARMREDFGNEMAALQTHDITSFELKLEHVAPVNESYQNPDVRGSNHPELDSLSLGLGRYLQSQNLVTIMLSGPICVGPELFWSDGSSVSTPEWPSLQKFDIDISPVSPDGSWYLTRDPHSNTDDDGEDPGPLERESEDSDSEYDSDESFFDLAERPPDEFDEERDDLLNGDSPIWRFRIWPTPELVKVFEAIARAAAHMPKLKTLGAGVIIQMRSRTNGEDRPFEVVFAAKGQTDYNDENSSDVEKDRLYWSVPKQWRMDEQMTGLWKQVLAEDAVVKYEDW